MLRSCEAEIRAFRAEVRACADAGEPGDAGGLGNAGEPGDAGGLGGDGGAKFTDDKGAADDIGDVGET